MTRWTTTSGQRVYKARLGLTLGDSTFSCSTRDVVDSSMNGISENLSQAYFSDREDDHDVFEPETNVETYIPGIEWICISPNLSSVKHMHFTECMLIRNHSLATFFFSDIEKKLFLGYAGIFHTTSDAELEKLDGEAATTVGSTGLSTKPFNLH